MSTPGSSRAGAPTRAPGRSCSTSARDWNSRGPRCATAAPGRSAGADRWYEVPAGDVASRIGVDPAAGLSSTDAAHRLDRDGPNALPVEKAVPGWKRLLQQYRSYMQIILLGAAIVSLAIKEWWTAVLLVAITLLNAVVGVRQEGKAESAMNALKAMVEGHRARAPRRRRGRDPGRGGGRRRRRAARRRRGGARRRPDRRGKRAADRRVGADGRERAGVEGRRAAGRRRSSPPASRGTWRSCTPRSRTAAGS